MRCVPAENRRGYRVEYQYIGRWKSWVRGKKWLPLLAELAVMVLYFPAASRNHAINCVRLASGLGALSLLPWLLEASGVLRLACSGQYIRELAYEEIDGSIRKGCIFRALLSALSAVVGFLSSIRDGTVLWQNAGILAALMLSAAISVGIWKYYDWMLTATFRSIAGKPGPRV